MDLLEIVFFSFFNGLFSSCLRSRWWMQWPINWMIHFYFCETSFFFCFLGGKLRIFTCIIVSSWNLCYHWNESVSAKSTLQWKCCCYNSHFNLFHLHDSTQSHWTDEHNPRQCLPLYTITFSSFVVWKQCSWWNKSNNNNFLCSFF